jgi:glycosyltransferase involved in cell wall biosynthesis/ubiquinone/menaquinone biosynthesis C-methylase UbiE
MRVLIISLAYLPFVGGAELAIKEITDRVEGINFDMITVNLDGKQQTIEQINNVKVYRLGRSKLAKYFFPFTAFKKAQQLHQQNKYDVVWALMANQAGIAAIKFKKRFPKVKYLLTLQKGDSLKRIWSRTWFMRPVYKNIYRKADFIQSISNYLAKRAKKYGYQGPIEIVPNGVDLLKFKKEFSELDLNQVRQELGLTSRDKIVTTISRLVFKNGVDNIIKAVKDLPVKVLIIGSGRLEIRLAALAQELGVKDKILFLGYIDQKDLVQYLKISDVFVRVSRSEGLGSAFLEAMAAETPVIATKVGGIPDFLIDGENGLFCEVNNPSDLAAKIQLLLSDNSLREKLIDNARNMVYQNYSWQMISGKMKKIFIGLQQPEIKFKKGKLLSGIIYPEFFPINKKESVLNVGCGDGVQALTYKDSFKKMVGVDINQKSLETAVKLRDYYNIDNFEVVEANIESIPLDEKFDKVIAIDSIEHVVNPDKMVNEINRLLEDNGKLLVTFPAMHDKWENLFRFIGRRILRRKGKTVYKEGWDPNQHQYNYKLKKWISIIEANGFEFIDSRASTLFPPLHYLGIPRFWFSNKFIHTVDNYFCKLPVIKNYGQSLVCVFKKIK